MNEKHIQIGIDSPDRAFQRFVDKWKDLEARRDTSTEVHFNVEDFTMFMNVLSPNRINLLRTLKQHGPTSIRGLSKILDRDYKNVHTDVKVLLDVELIVKDSHGQLEAPWDVIDATVQLVA